MKQFLIALSIAMFFGGAAQAKEIINYTQVTPTAAEDGSRVVQMPDRKATSRRRMLVDLGLFGAGIHIGWLKPKNVELQAQDGSEQYTIKRRRGFGMPILNVSAGTYAVGLGTK